MYPATIAMSKQLLPVYDKPLIYYPLSVLMLGGIRDVLIITTPSEQAGFIKLLGDGSRWGINISYEVQPRPNGLAEAFIIGKDFIGPDPVSMILGDNIFYGPHLGTMVRRGAELASGATVFASAVDDPERYGVVGFDAEGNATSIVEKPTDPVSSWAVTGLYQYDNSVVDRAFEVKPSDRGELEITSINNMYLDEGLLRVEQLGRGYAWLDAGTFDSMVDASDFVRVIEKRSRMKVASPEEVAWRMGFIDNEQLMNLAAPMKNSGYGIYLMGLLSEPQIPNRPHDES